MRLLLHSTTRLHGREPFAHCGDEVRDFLRGVRTLTFVPHALQDHDGYAASMARALAPLGVAVRPLHEAQDARAAIGEAEAIYVGGGNTFRLLDALQRLGVRAGEGGSQPSRSGDLLAAIRARVGAGVPYMGSSAGSNLACPTIMTTNDMPIVRPRDFDALGLVPFQINPHYLDPDPSSAHMGETREQRIREYLEENDRPVLGLREGAHLRREGDALELGGVAGARLFRRGREPTEHRPGESLAFLLAPDRLPST